jgi:PAS domain S-box-containing protein
MTLDAKKASLRIAAIYGLIGCAWILISDRILLWFVRDPILLDRLEIFKGWFFILASAALLAWLIHRYAAGYQREVEDRLTRERELFHRTQLLENVIANIPAYVFWKDRDSNYLGCNQRFASVAGVGRPEKIVGKTDYALGWGGDAAAPPRYSDSRVMEKGQPLLEFEERQRQADGNDAVFLGSKVPLRGEGDEVMGLIGIYTDITLLKRAEETLRQALHEAEDARIKLDGILASVPEGLIVTDLEDRVILMNRAAEDLLAIPQKEALGRSIDEAIKENPLRDRLKTVLAEKISVVILDVRLPGASRQRPRFIQARTSVIQSKEGGVAGMITLLLDTTREHEQDRLKTEFIATAARDFRGPLASIQGFSELLLARPDLPAEERSKFLTHINDEALTLSRFVKNHLDIALIESGGELHLERAPCDLSALLERMARYFREKNPRHRLEFDVPPSPVEAEVDGGRVEQVLNNVLANAIKYSPGGGTIRVRGEVHPDIFRIQVTDQGPGMPREEQERIFEKFFRGPASSKGTEGLGLGLNIAKHIVEAHGGAISVESAPGRGTIVTIALPLAGETKGSEPERAHRGERGPF